MFVNIIPNNDISTPFYVDKISALNFNRNIHFNAKVIARRVQLVIANHFKPISNSSLKYLD